ncbi:ankyrin repeat domain-containing protein [Variovorax sp. HJSM1_2]|uniref:ankyrin repeat domain-containing protein n=1 Tax=Variovorax sp. HJSM1_2 TaxID=3366263 RepID=UPI003BD6A375
MRNYFRYFIYLFVFIGFSASSAGSFEDYFAAVARDDASTVQNLLRRGFDPNTVNEKGLTGVFIAVRTPSPKVLNVLLAAPKIQVETRNEKDESPLMLAALQGDLATCQKLIAKDADVNKTGWAPLHYAATNGHVAVMQLLLDENAYIDAESPNKTTPLMMAASYGSTEAVKFLLEAGADPTLKNEKNLSALDFAQKASRPDAIELIGAAVRKRGVKQGTW